MTNQSHVLRFITASSAAGYVQSLQDAAESEAVARGPSQVTKLLSSLAADLRRHFASKRAGTYVIDITFHELPDGNWHFDAVFGLPLPARHKSTSG